MTNRNIIVGIGETLFDVIGNQSALGGAPLNFCVMVNQLLCSSGFTTAVVSSVGNDELGTTARRHLDNESIDTTHLQTHPTLPTGQARIIENVGDHVECDFEILSNVAWDKLRWTLPLQEFTNHVSCVVFGTLAQRCSQSRETIQHFLSACPAAMRLFDVNLRTPHYDAETISKGCQAATILKLNQHELSIVADAINIQPCQDPHATCVQLLRHFSLEAVVLTASEKGTTIVTADQTFVGNVPPVVVQSSVGAGDACTAGIVAGLTLNFNLARVVGLANQMGALVASNTEPNLTIPTELINAYILNG